MQKMCLNCEFFEQTEEHIRNELTLGKCTLKQMRHCFPEGVKAFIPGTVLCCIHFKVKPGLTEDATIPLRNDSRTRGARSVLDALEKKNPSLRRGES